MEPKQDQQWSRPDTHELTGTVTQQDNKIKLDSKTDREGLAEPRFRKQRVGGSIPLAGFIACKEAVNGWRSRGIYGYEL